ncbi:MAG: tail fiber domain-containing protein [Thermodesulfovibrionales bacterium]
MKKWILILVTGLLLVGVNVFAADGDLIVNGKAGIGTASPDPAVQVTIESTVGILYWRPAASLGVSATGFLGFVSKTDAATPVDNVLIGSTGTSNSNIMFKTAGAYRMIITNTGNTGIGTITPSYQLQLSTDSAAKLSTNTWTIASDARLKTNIQSYTKGLKEILQINPVTYKYNGKGGIGHNKVTSKDPVTGEEIETEIIDTELLSKTNVGVLAKDIQSVVPEAVSSHKGKINKDDTDETDILDFNSHPLTFILINAVKELKAQIDSLEEQIADLKAKVK